MDWMQIIAGGFVVFSLLALGWDCLQCYLSSRAMKAMHKMTVARNTPKEVPFSIRLAERIYLAHEVLAKVAEKKQPKPVTFTESDYCPL